MIRYANRAKNIKNKPKINEDPKDTMLREMKLEIERLKAELENVGDGPPSSSSSLMNAQDKQSSSHQSPSQSQNPQSEKLLSQAKNDVMELITQNKAIADEKSALRFVFNKFLLDWLFWLCSTFISFIHSSSSFGIVFIVFWDSQKLAEEEKKISMVENQKTELAQKLKEYEHKLLLGGELQTKNEKNEAELRKAQNDLERGLLFLFSIIFTILNWFLMVVEIRETAGASIESRIAQETRNEWEFGRTIFWIASFI